MTKRCSKCLLQKSLDQFDCRIAYKNRVYYSGECKKCRCSRQQNAYKKNPAIKNNYSKTWAKANAEHLAKHRKEKRAAGLNVKEKEWFRLRAQENRKNPLFRLKANLRTRLWEALKLFEKSNSTMELVGCSLKELKNHLESKFQPGMTWNNYGKWHVDHIEPCSIFNLSQPDEQAKCFHYTNLQPLWAADNIRKGTKTSLNSFFPLKITAPERDGWCNYS